MQQQKAEATASDIVRILLADAQKKRDNMQYAEAVGILQNAAEIGVLANEVAAALSEYVFYYALAHNLSDAEALFEKACKLKKRPCQPIGGAIIDNNYKGTAKALKPVIIGLANASFYTEIKNRYLPEMVAVKGGTFMMGSENGEDNEKPIHEVTLSDYSMGKYEVTEVQYFLFCEATFRYYSGRKESQEPVNVNWYDAVAYSNYASEALGLTPVYDINKALKDANNLSDDDESKWTVTANWQANGFRLPTEAEWEYAARGGQVDQGKYEYSGGDTLDELGWHGSKPHPVGGKKPNGLGLYDLSGNVWEWCWDWYGAYPADAQNNPQGNSGGSDRVGRGGSWRSDASYSRVASRFIYSRDDRAGRLGFRICKTD